MRFPSAVKRVVVAAAAAAATIVLPFPARAQFREGTVPIRVLTGEAAGDNFGWVLDVVGDLDGDGAQDLVIGAPFNDAGGSNAGRAYVHSSRTGARLFTFTGTPGSSLGFGVDGAGDVDGDGVPDVIVGAPAAAPAGAGSAEVRSGADGSRLWTFAGTGAMDVLGSAVAGAGDVDGDGRDDVIVGAPGASVAGPGFGRATVFSGATGLEIFSVDGEGSGHGFGGSVGGRADFDGDGRSDFLVGAQNAGATGRGRLYAYSGATGTLLFPPIDAEVFGSALGQFWLESPGDVNRDGVPDIFAVDISYGSGRGRAYVFSGVDGAMIVGRSGEARGDQFGIGRGAGDVDGDGYADLFVAGWLNDAGAANAGKAYVLSGRTGAFLQTFTHTILGATLGFDAAGLESDANGDGIFDYAISSEQGTGAGKVYVLPGRVGPPSLGAERLFVAAGPAVRGHDAITGSFVLALDPGGAAMLAGARAVRPGPEDGLLAVASFADDRVARFDAASGAFVDEYFAPGAAGLDGPSDLLFTGDGALLVASFGTNEVLAFAAPSGAPAGAVAAAGAGGLSGPAALALTPGDDGASLAVASALDDRVLRFDRATGAFLGELVGPGAGGLDEPRGLAFAPNGELLVASFATDEVLRFDAASGAPLGAFVTAGSGGLDGPSTTAFGIDGSLYVASAGSGGVLRFDGANGTFVGVFATGAAASGEPFGFAFAPEPALWLGAPAPGLAGVANTIAARRASPGAEVVFAFSRDVAPRAIPGCPGPGALLAGAKLGGKAVADAAGVATLSLAIPSRASGRAFAVQAFVRARCERSGVVRVRLP